MVVWYLAALHFSSTATRKNALCKMCKKYCYFKQSVNDSQEDEALDALRIVCEALSTTKLKRLNLSDNALGEKGVRACAESITSQV